MLDRRTKHSQEAVDIAVSLYLAGHSMLAVQKLTGIDDQSVKRYLVARSIDVRNPKPNYSDTIKRNAIELYVTHQMSADEVARVLGLKDYTIKDWLNKEGIIRTMSEAACLSTQLRGPRGRRATRVFYESSKTGQCYFAESSFEVARMAQLDRDNAVILWFRCGDRIPYRDEDGKLRHYNPDLSVHMAGGGHFVEEIKPHSRLDEPRNKAKFTAARSFYSAKGSTFRTITESDLDMDLARAHHAMPSSEELKKRRRRLAKDARTKRLANENIRQAEERRSKETARARDRRRGRVMVQIGPAILSFGA